MAGAFREAQPSASAEPPPPTSTPPLAQFLSLDPLSPTDPKHSRHGELRRALQADDHHEELKRIRASVADSSAKARDRARSLQDAIQKLDRYKNIVTRKRHKSDPGPDRDRLGGGSGSSGALRIGAQNNSAPMNKRVRSSLADGRSEGRGSVPTRQGPLVNSDKSAPLEKEKSCARISGTVSGPSEDKLQGLSTAGEGWENKLKRKRSVGTMLNRGSDADRDVKPMGQHKLANEARPRSSDGLAYRHGASAGAVAGSKVDGGCPQNNIGSRILSKTDVAHAALPNERRERHAGIEKERALVKGNKAHTSEDIQTGGLSPLPKAKACRAPRTSSLVMGSPSTFQHSVGINDEWEETTYSNKASPLGGMTNRKRSTHSNASSPPITWGGQRPQKMSRTRRANVVSPVSNFDEVLSEGSPLDTSARSTPVESCGVSLPKNATGHTQTVTKMDNISSPAGLSESEGSAATESKAKEKVRNNGEVENEGANSVHSATGLIFPSNKNRIPLKEELEDGGVRRQGRSGRGTMHVKGCSSTSRERLDGTETRKPLKGVRPGPEKIESKLGRPMTKKGSDSKSSPCHAQALNCKSKDISGNAEDDQEELLAAANAARNAIVGAYSGPFWKKMEPMLTFISSENLAFLQHQINVVEELELSMSCMPDGEHDVIASTDYSRAQPLEVLSSHVLAPSNSSLLPEQSKTNGVGAKGPINCSSPGEESHNTERQKVHADKWIHEMAPMAHRLLSALIMEDDFSDFNGLQGNILVEYSNSHIPCNASRYLESELQASAITSNFELNVDFTNSNDTSVVHQSSCNGYTACSNFISSNGKSFVHSENLSVGVNFTAYPETGPLHDLIPQISLKCQNPGNFFPSPPYECQYGQMSVNDKVLIELQNIGICPETVPKLDGEDEDINKMISELSKRLHDQVQQKKCKLHKLDQAIQDTKSIEERSLEQHAMNKLVERAYKKLKGGRVGSSHKAGFSKSANKAAKQLALAFAKRTLARCQKFEETKKSCFGEPGLWSVLSAPLPSSNVKPAEGVERLKLQKLDRSPLDQGGTKWKKSDRERDHKRDASAKGSGLKLGRHSSSSGRSGERKNKTKPKQKLAQLSTSGNVLSRVVESFPSPATREAPEPAGPPSAKITQQLRNAPGSAAPRSTNAALTNLPGLDDILDVPGGLDGQGNDFTSWFTDGLDDPLDIDLSGALEIPDDDLTQLAFM